MAKVEMNASLRISHWFLVPKVVPSGQHSDDVSQVHETGPGPDRSCV